MSIYIKRGAKVTVANEESIKVTKELPAGVYYVKYEAKSDEFYLEVGQPITVTNKLYGDVEERANLVINTYESRGCNTGVLLEGLKGSGKTLLTKVITSKLIEHGLPTLIVAASFPGSKLADFLQSIDLKCCVIFDEFDKYYSTDYNETVLQEPLLTLLDGTIAQKKLFLMVANNSKAISPHILGRPGRAYYRFKYAGIDIEAFAAYISDLTTCSKTRAQLNNLVSTNSLVSFDSIKAIVEECNRYNKLPNEVLAYINTNTLQYRRQQLWKIDILKDNELVTSESVNISCITDSVCSLTPFTDLLLRSICIEVETDEKAKALCNYYKDLCDASYTGERCGECVVELSDIVVTTDDLKLVKNGMFVFELKNLNLKITIVNEKVDPVKFLL